MWPRFTKVSQVRIKPILSSSPTNALFFHSYFLLQFSSVNLWVHVSMDDNRSLCWERVLYNKTTCSILNRIHRRGGTRFFARASRKWTWLGSDVARQPIKSLFSLFARTNPPNRKQALTVAETAKTKHFTLISKFLFQHRLETNWRLEILWWNPNWVRIGLEWPEKRVSFP